MYRLTLIILLLQGLGLVWPAQTNPPLGLTVHVVPQDSSQGQTVRAHFTAITSGTCTPLSGLCADGEDCSVENNNLPFNGNNPGSGWCTYQWQKTVPSNYKGTIALGNAELYLELKTDPVIRANSGKLNQPAYVGLPPPLRARKNCPRDFTLSVKDLDGDKVHCRFANADAGECVNCEQLSFIKLDQESCTLSFTGGASVGLYYIYLMAEDLVPVPKVSQSTQNKPLSAVPVLLSLTVEETKYSCSAEPVATADTPAMNSVLYILPFHQESFTVDYDSEEESVSEIAVVGPPELYRNNFTSIGLISAISIAWVRSENHLTRLLPICFAANTNSLQSESRCVWLYQREMMSLPAGTVLTCEKTEMTLILPITSFANLNATELKLNSPTCPVSYNDTHLTARIPLEGCGTKAVHSGQELIYTNTLQTVRSYTKVIRRQPTLVLPLACRIPAVQAKGSQYKVLIPSEEQVFGKVAFMLEFYFPGQGPLQRFSQNPTFRFNNQRISRALSSASNDVSGAVGSKIPSLDLYVTSNCTVPRAEILVGSCQESATEDFAVSFPILEQGCTATGSALEINTTLLGTKIYRLDLTGLKNEGSTMYVKCTVNLCLPTLPSQTCPDLCTTKLNQRPTMVNSVFSKTYTIRSGAVSLVVTTSPPITTTPIITTTPTTSTTAKPATPIQSTTAVNPPSHAPEKASSMAVRVIVATVGIFLQNVFLT